MKRLEAGSIHIVETLHNRQIGPEVYLYLTDILAGQNPHLQVCPFVDRQWGDVLRQFDPQLDHRLHQIRSNSEKFSALMTSLVSRSIELVSGGVVSSREIPEGARRGLLMGGTWPDNPGGHFWHPKERRSEKIWIEAMMPRLFAIETNASRDHIGRVMTMCLPALLSWSDITGGLITQEDIIVAVKRMLEAEHKGIFNVYTFGCEPYEYEFKPISTTSHFRRSVFGSEKTIRMDAIHGSFRAVRRILEPLALTGIGASYHFFTSFGSSWELIQRQVMPDTMNHYRYQASPEEMLDHLNWWRSVIEQVGSAEFAGSSLQLYMREMEYEVVLPALERLGRVLETCGMVLPENKNIFYMGSEDWFHRNMQDFGLLAFVQSHPYPTLLIEFLKNEEQWSRLHEDSYKDERERKTLATLLSFFEFHQYERINELINESDIALGVEIDEELILTIRKNIPTLETEQTPLLWGRPPRFTKDGEPGGVAHRQPWFYAK